MGSAGLKDDIQFRSFAGPALMAPTQTIRTEDGRTLRVAEGGDSGGWPLIAHHGTPACGNLYPAHDRYALEHGIRLIGYDRPGYGGSVRSLGRRVADARGDVLAIADHLELARFSVWGHSGGGPHAIACAATLPDRVASAAASGSCAPFEAGGLDWIAGMGEGNIQEFRASLEGPEALERFLQPEWNAIRAEEDELSPELRSLLSPEDFELLRENSASTSARTHASPSSMHPMDGLTTISHSSRIGGSTLQIFAFRPRSGTESSTVSYLIRMGCGSPSIFRSPSSDYLTRRPISPFSNGSSRKSPSG